MSQAYVWSYVKARKKYDSDTEAISKMATHPTIRYVELKVNGNWTIKTRQHARNRLGAHGARRPSGARYHRRTGSA